MRCLRFWHFEKNIGKSERLRRRNSGMMWNPDDIGMMKREILLKI
jgi:hypothetical protein